MTTVKPTIELSVVIVTWNAKQYIVDCLRSVEEQKTGLATEIIVVDNASSDGTADAVRQLFPNVKLIESPINLGFAKGNNVGIAETSGKYLFLINPDVIVLPDCLKTLITHLDDPSVGLVGPSMLGTDRMVQRSTMRFPSVWNSFCRALALDSLFKGSKTFGGYLMSDFNHDRNADVDILNGWFWGVRRDALNQVGVLDDKLFMYGDDLDWSYRFHDAGYRNLFCSDAASVHYGGGTTARAPAYFYVERQRANIQFWRKYHSWLGVTSYIVTVWLNEAIRIFGYSLVYLLKRSARTKAALKIKLSLACLSWLSGFRSNARVTA